MGLERAEQEARAWGLRPKCLAHARVCYCHPRLRTLALKFLQSADGSASSSLLWHHRTMLSVLRRQYLLATRGVWLSVSGLRPSIADGCTDACIVRCNCL